jgi:hypothetical protein
MKTGGGVLGKLIGTLIVLAVITLIVKHPTDSATWLTSIFHMLGQAVDGIAGFLHDLFG